MTTFHYTEKIVTGVANINHKLAKRLLPLDKTNGPIVTGLIAAAITFASLAKSGNLPIDKTIAISFAAGFAAFLFFSMLSKVTYSALDSKAPDSNFDYSAKSYSRTEKADLAADATSNPISLSFVGVAGAVGFVVDGVSAVVFCCKKKRMVSGDNDNAEIFRNNSNVMTQSYVKVQTHGKGP